MGFDGSEWNFTNNLWGYHGDILYYIYAYCNALFFGLMDVWMIWILLNLLNGFVGWIIVWTDLLRINNICLKSIHLVKTSTSRNWGPCFWTLLDGKIRHVDEKIGPKLRSQKEKHVEMPPEDW